jgi:hypothetical protein
MAEKQPKTTHSEMGCAAAHVQQQSSVTLEQVIIEAAECGATIQEIAAYLDTEEQWLKKNYGRKILQAWAKRTIRIRRAQTANAIHAKNTTADHLATPARLMKG